MSHLWLNPASGTSTRKPFQQRLFGCIINKVIKLENMKKLNVLLIIILLTVLIIPSVALAAWWNPFSWSVWNIFFSKH